MIEVFSDGSSSGRSNRPTGWGWVICKDQQIVAAGYGGEAQGTNNTAEVTGAIEGLKALKAYRIWSPGEPVTLISDSMYVLGMASGSNQPSKNKELCHELRELSREFDAGIRWVRGHSFRKSRPWQEQERDVLLNERCDGLAKLGRREASRVDSI